MALSLGIICCQDEGNMEIKENNLSSQLLILGDINYSMVFTNPYEEVGKYHNDGLAYAFDEFYKLSTSRSSGNKQEVLNKIMIDFFNKEKIPGGVNISNKENEDFLKRLEVRSRGVHAKEFENDTQRKYCEEIRHLLKGKKRIKNPQMLILEMNIIEKEVAGSNMSDIEKAQILVSTSVAKHSAVFWMEQMLTTNGNPAIIKSRSIESGDDFWLIWFNRVFFPKAERVLEADFVGAIAGIVEGFFFGGAVGSIVPGAGTVTVAITGAIADGTRGAIFGSVCEGIGIDWTFWN